MRTRMAAGLALAVSAALAGCGGSPSTTTTTATVGASVTATSPLTSTTTVAPGTSTTATTATSSTGPTVGPELPGTNKPTVLLGDMNTPEEFVIGALYQDVLANQGYTVLLNRNIGATKVSEAALKQGSLDIYPQYLNVYDADVAGLPTRFSTLADAYAAGQAYAQAHDETLLTPTPFSDTATLAVLSTYAHAHHLRSLADLARVQTGLTLGVPLEFALPGGGLDAIEQTYGWTPIVTSVVDIGSQYGGLKDGSLDAAYVQSTDSELSEPVLTALTDPRHALGFGNVVPVVSDKTLEEEGPVFVQAIDEVDALLTTSAIRGLVAEVSSSSDPAAAATGVAGEFLQGNGILAPPPWSTLTSTLTTPGPQTFSIISNGTRTSPPAAATSPGSTATAGSATTRTGPVAGG